MTGIHQSAGIVLCGGMSRRMGHSKANLRLGDGTFLTRSVRLLSALADPVIVAAAFDQSLLSLPVDIVVVRDAIPAAGPLAGFCGALAAVPNHRPTVYLLGCDLPFVTVDFLNLLAARLGDADAVVPFVDGRWHPLAALYARRVRAQADALLEAGERSMLAFLATLSVTPLTAAEMQSCDPSGQCLRNVNTPEEYAAALRDAGH